MNFWDERVRFWAQNTPDAIAFADERLQLTYAQLDSVSTKLISQLHQAGLSRSDRVVLALPRSTSLVAFMIALLRAELSGLVIDRGYISSTIEAISSALQPKAIIALKVDQSLIMNKLVQLAARTESVDLSLIDLETTGDVVALTDRSQPIDFELPLDLRWFLQTSGTTREPRLVMISENNLSSRASGEVRDFQLTQTDRVLNHLSFSHDLGLNQVLSVVAAGASLRIQTGPLILSLAKALREQAPTGITGTPMMWIQLLNATKGSFPSVRYLTISGGSLAMNVLEQLKSAFPNAAIIRTYGQTETFRTLLNPNSSDPSLGKPIAGVTATIVNADGSECAAYEIGELVHSGAGEMLGYWRDEVSSRTKKTLCGIRTGDRFLRDSNGGFHFAGRDDDMLKRFEHRFNISEVEAAIRAVPGVAEVVICTKPALPTDPRQVLLAAFVSMESGSSPAEKELLHELQQRLAAFKVPDRIFIVSDFPKTVSYKIDRVALQKRWIEES